MGAFVSNIKGAQERDGLNSRILSPRPQLEPKKWVTEKMKTIFTLYWIFVAQYHRFKNFVLTRALTRMEQPHWQPSGYDLRP